MARGFFHVERVVARIADPDREEVFSSLGLNCICHTNLACDAMYAALTESERDRTVRFGGQDVKFCVRPVKEEEKGIPLSQLPMKPGEYPFALHYRNGQLRLYPETAHSRVQPGDVVLTVRRG